MLNQTSTKVMSVFSLIMLNVIAIDSLRGVPFGAMFGFSIIFYYIIGAICFFIPCALVAAELASRRPGGPGVIEVQSRRRSDVDGQGLGPGTQCKR